MRFFLADLNQMLCILGLEILRLHKHFQRFWAPLLLPTVSGKGWFCYI